MGHGGQFVLSSSNHLGNVLWYAKHGFKNSYFSAMLVTFVQKSLKLASDHIDLGGCTVILATSCLTAADMSAFCKVRHRLSLC